MSTTNVAEQLRTTTAKAIRERKPDIPWSERIRLIREIEEDVRQRIEEYYVTIFAPALKQAAEEGLSEARIYVPVYEMDELNDPIEIKGARGNAVYELMASYLGKQGCKVMMHEGCSRVGRYLKLLTVKW